MSPTWLDGLLSPRFVVGVGAFLALVARALRGPLDDPDTWWHLVQGQWMWDTRSVLRHDVFSVLEWGEPMVAHSWLAEVIFAVVHEAGGFAFLVGLRAVLLVLTYGVLVTTLGRLRASDLTLWAVAILAAVAGTHAWAIRPTLFGLLLFAATVYLLQPETERSPWWLLPVFVLWANLHGSWVLGLGVVGLFTISQLVRPDRMERTSAVGLIVGCGLATLLNPYGPRLHTHAAELVLGIRNLRIQEWMPQGLSEPDDYLLLLLAVATLVVALWKRRELELLDLLLVGAFVVLSAVAARNAAFAAMVFAVMLGRYVPSPRPHPDVTTPPSATQNLLAGLAMAAAVVVCAVAIIRYLPTDETEAVGPDLPGRLLRWLPAEEPPSRLLTLDRWGGLALYLRWPDVLVLNDTRVDLYGPEGVRLHRALLRGQRLESLDDLCITDVVVPSTLPIIAELGGEWRTEAHQQLASEASAIHKRRALPADCDPIPALPRGGTSMPAWGLRGTHG